MKRFFSALAFCILLLGLLSAFLLPRTRAKENVLIALLALPAPPPRNPALTVANKNRDPKFYSRGAVPKDNAPIEDLLDYWKQQSETYQKLRYTPEPSDAVRERLMREVEKNPRLMPGYLNILSHDPKWADFVKELYDREGTGGVFQKDDRIAIRRWLTYNSPYFSSDLARAASQVADANDYVTNQDDLLALTRVDFDRAQPIIDRLYNDGSLRASRVLARWALYRHAIETDSTSDIERYRDELKEVVEDKTLPAPMRDLAMDALVSEKDWAGRDDWYMSLLADETLADMGGYTGLTTLMLVSPEDKYIEKMLELLKSDNPAVRGAAVRNLITRLETGNPDIIRALLPWLEDPKWALDRNGSRQALVQKLNEIEMSESVPGLISILDEKERRTAPDANVAMNMANTALVWAYANSNRKPSNTSGGYGAEIVTYPYRYSAVTALGKQKDPRAVPALRRILPEGEGYARNAVVKALLDCGGFSIPEQLAALDVAAKGVRAEMDAGEAEEASPDGYVRSADYYANAANAAVNAMGYGGRRTPPTAAEIRAMLGQQLLGSEEIGDDLARGIVDRIELLDQKDPRLAAAYRRMVLRWQNPVINVLFLRDVKRGMADVDTIVRLLGARKTLRERLATDVSDLRTGKPAAIAFAACMLEDTPEYTTILENADAEAKTALLACARLIRAPLPIAKVADCLKAPTPLLNVAAERYLESEDSPEARSIVLARHPGEARILGAMVAFVPEDVAPRSSEYLYALFQSLGDDSLYNGWSGSGNDDQLKTTEKRLQEEVKKDQDLAGIYAYDRNYIRIYKDRVVFSWDEDDTRYRERTLTKYEFDEIKSYLTTNRADELPPFISCGGGYCTAKELVMLGRNGGRRVYTNGGPEMYEGSHGYDFFAGLDKYFADLKKSPASVKYALSREIPGLEIVLASDDLEVETVWKEGNDLLVAAGDTAVRQKVKSEIEGDDETGDETSVVDDPAEDDAAKAEQLEKRRYEGLSWYRVMNGTVAGVAQQPPSVEFIPVRDSLAVQPTSGQWKARVGDVEVRTSEEGVFKVVGGRLTKLRSGPYSKAVMTPNGRWAIVYKSSDSDGGAIMRIDLVTGKEYQVDGERWAGEYPLAFVPTVGKVLVGSQEGYRSYDNGEDAEVEGYIEPGVMALLDPATGVKQPIAGEFRPIAQQSFRPLQKTAKPNEFWAAIPDPEKQETVVGTYDTKLFGFRPVLKIPKIVFNSMNMYVDEAGGKVYFVYRGHLLALPLNR